MSITLPASHSSRPSARPKAGGRGLGASLGRATKLDSFFHSAPALATLVLGAAAGFSPAISQVPESSARPIAGLEYARQPPAQVRGAEACGECHLAEQAIWRETTHATGFRTMHRKAEAEEIASRLGLALIKRGSVCVRCHYTPTVVDDELRALSGVSCESCHGAGLDWIETHSGYGADADHFSESAAHREARLQASVEAGMLLGASLYSLASVCYDCHFVPDEELINLGGHATGSADFELVAWSGGKIRHNVVAAQWGGGDANLERPIERRRVMYVVGQGLALEHTLRALAAASEPGIYLQAMQRRLRGATSELRALVRAATIPELERALAAAGRAEPALGHGAQLLAAADRVGEAIRELAGRADGRDWAAIDALMAGGAPADAPEISEGAGERGAAPRATAPGDARGTRPLPSDAAAATAIAPQQQAGSVDVGRDDVPDDVPDDEPGPLEVASGDADPTAGSLASDQAQQVVGARRDRIRPSSQHATLGGACSGCHAEQNGWWFSHRHYQAADRFFDQDPDTMEIATLYGVSTSQVTRGTSICMDCHGTVVSGRESREVQDGVGCEGCHGPAGDYLKPHEIGDKALRESRPGYIEALRQGLRRLSDERVRAETCAACHYVTDPRLLSSGHPSGADFDFAEAIGDVRHWEAPLEPDGRLALAYQGVVAARGPVPDVPIARRAATPSGRLVSASTVRAPSGGGEEPGSNVAVVASREVGRVAVVAEENGSHGEPVAAPVTAPVTTLVTGPRAFEEDPVIVPTDGALADVLSAIQRRLEQLRRQYLHAGHSAGEAER